MKLESTQESKNKWASFEEPIKSKLEYLRELIISTAEEIETLEKLEETLKWGELSYVTKKGSAIRINKRKDPNKYAMYFNCSSSLVATFRILFKEIFVFEDNRAIVFELNKKIPERELKQCISAALRYHNIKQLPLLDM